MSITPVDLSLEQLADQIASTVVEKLWARLRQGDQLIAPEYLSPKQVSQLTGIAVKTLEAMRSIRKGPPHYKVGGRVRYKIQDVRDFIEDTGPVE